MGNNERAIVDALDTTSNRLGLRNVNRGYASGQTPPRPFLGGLSSGFHTIPNQNDEVLILKEDMNYPSCVVSTTFSPASLPSLNMGESVILHSDGRQVAYLKNDHTTVLYSDTHGGSITIDSGGDLTLAGTNLTLSGPVALTGQTVSTSPGTFSLDGSSHAQYSGYIALKINGNTYHIPFI